MRWSGNHRWKHCLQEQRERKTGKCGRRQILQIGHARHKNCISRNGRQKHVPFLIRNGTVPFCLGLVRIGIKDGNRHTDSENHSGQNGQTYYERLSAHYFTAIASISTLTPSGSAAA